MNNFNFSLDNKRYHTHNFYLKNKFDIKVGRVALNGNFTCPNRDGTKGFGGCIFCSDSGSGDHGGDVNKSLEEQFNDMTKIMDRKWPGCKFIAYFQANTNTYGPLLKIKNMIEPFLKKKDIVGISLATRADCLDDEVVDYLASLNDKTDLWVELGLQTIHDKTSELVNRGHTYKEFLEGLNKLRKRNIKVCVHVINGLPFETREMMLETIKEVATLDIQAIKIHMLFVLKNTLLNKMYNNNEFTLLSREEYIDLVVEQLAYIPEHIVIERLTGDAPKDELIAPLWSLKKVTILNDIDKLMKQKNVYQGSKT